ncbi:lipopolysaccharide biosynthesis protein [Marinobacter sp. LN3S78]|uniref:lipopolysaccharide biosynthesis protein n=1 Tax=Marinobacter sp. LN3S78 TaxID=3382300 RepID=UPI00387AC98E
MQILGSFKIRLIIQRYWSVVRSGVASILRKDKKLTRDVVSTFICRAITAFSSVILVVLLGRRYGLDAVGFFATVQSLYLGFSVLTRFGVNNSLIYYVGRNKNSKNISYYLFLSVVTACIFSLVLSGIIFSFGELLVEKILVFADLELALNLALFAPLFTMTFVLSGFLKAVRKPVSAVFLENGGIAIVMIIFTLANLELGLLLEIEWLYALSVLLIFMVGMVQVGLYLRTEKFEKATTDEAKSGVGAYLRTSSSYFVISLANFCQNSAVFIIAAYLLSESEVGLFKVAHQIALTLSFILVVTNAVFPPKFAELFRKGDFGNLISLAKMSCVIGFVFALPVLLMIIMFPDYILGMIGEEFKDAQILLIVLVGAQSVNVITGNVNFLLSMTGHERIMRNIVLTTSSIGIICFSFLTLFVGVVGAAIGLSMMIVAQNLIAVIFVRKILSKKIMIDRFVLDRRG